jgi:alkanesulfonate monooxygenase SsuD/methylene tetrahydromethanopterin reductase-like flavin-dependent oxidoreductase (luciferase family)
MLLAAVAAGTRTIRLATTSYLLPLRHPLQAAEQVAVLDQLSGGRVTLGVGRGYAAPVLRAFDVAPREKRTLFESALTRMIDAWSGGALAYGENDAEGTGAALRLDPLPVQRPHPPIWVAAFGPKALAQAGRLGLPYLASPVESLELLEDNYRRHRLAATEAGRPLPDAVPVMRSVFVTESAAETQRIRYGLSERGPANVEAWAIVGEPGYVQERVAEHRERLGMTHLIVARLRLAGLPPERVARSVEHIAELLIH